MTARPNILYIVCHDIGKHLNCYGAQGVPSPNLDHLAARGATFTNCFTNSPCCSPSRGCAMTGQYAHTNGLMGLVNMGWSLPEQAQTVVDVLNAAGYETAHFGFQHERHVSTANRYQIEGLPPYPEDDWVNREQEWAERAVDGAIDYLAGHAGSDRPFYLNVGTVEVHASRWQGGFPEGNAQNRASVYGIDPSERVYVPPYVPDVPQMREVLGRFQGAIRYLDTQVQRLLNAAERLEYAQDTLVIFTTDHGIANMRAKGTVYDRGVEIALLMHMPGVIPEGLVVTDLIQNIDIAPTILQAAGVAIPSTMQGKSFWPLFTGAAYEPHQAIFIERNWHSDYDPVRSVRTKQFHYIRNFGQAPKKAWLPDEVGQLNESYTGSFIGLWPEPSQPRPEEELFDVEKDPDEFVNLAQDANYQHIKARLAAQLDRWMHKTDDPLLQGPIPDKLNGWPKR